MGYISEFYDTDKRPSRALSVTQCGWQKSEANHSFGPFVRDHYVLHYIVKGKGTYCCGTQEYKLERNQGFLIPPNKSTFYKADNDDPWEYYWVGFQGTEALKLVSNINLGADKLIFTYNKDDAIEKILNQLYFSSKDYESREYAMVGYLYLFFSSLTQKKISLHKPSEEYINKAVQYMEDNYAYPITVSDIAKNTRVERSYLFRLFKSNFNCSISGYLQSLRLEKALQMMSNFNISITQIAVSHGFHDLPHFSKLFKKKYGVFPKEYRKSQINSNVLHETSQ